MHGGMVGSVSMGPWLSRRVIVKDAQENPILIIHPSGLVLFEANFDVNILTIKFMTRVIKILVVQG